jgi:hypothetical protein
VVERDNGLQSRLGEDRTLAAPGATLSMAKLSVEVAPLSRALSGPETYPSKVPATVPMPPPMSPPKMDPAMGNATDAALPTASRMSRKPSVSPLETTGFESPAGSC